MSSAFKKLLLAAMGALGAGTARADAITLEIIQAGPMSAAAAHAVSFLESGSGAAPKSPLLEFHADRVAPATLCATLRRAHGAVYVATLSIYRHCELEVKSLGALDFPFIAHDWATARKLLNGPIGSAIADGLATRGLTVIAYWDGETRVLTSTKYIKSLFELRGKKLYAPQSFSGTVALKQLGATRVTLPHSEVFDALKGGAINGADLPLEAAQQIIADTQKSVFLSNHYLDPYVLAVPSETLTRLSASQRAYLDSTVLTSTTLEIADAQRDAKAALELLGKRDITVLPYSPETTELFSTAAVRRASSAMAEVVFAQVPQLTRGAAIALVEGKPFSTAWKVYFATDRARRGSEYSNDVAGAMTYGQAEVQFSWDGPAVSPAGPQDPTVAGLMSYRSGGPEVDVAWKSVSTTPPTGMTVRVAHRVPARAPIVYVHGFANTFIHALKAAAWIGWNAKRPVIAFAWPSQGVMSLDDYRKDRQTAKKAKSDLARLLSQLGRDYDSKTDIDIVAHRMGAHVLLGALEELQRQNPKGKPILFRQLILAAPDVASARLQRTWRSLLKFFESETTLYVSNHDMALRISRSWLNPRDGPRAGLAPPVLVTDGIASIFIGPNDFSFIGHSYHLENGPIVSDMVEALRYATPAGDRTDCGLDPNGGHYYVLRKIEGL